MSTVTASSILLGIEKSIRHAPDMMALQFVAVTETRRLLSYQQAVLFSVGLRGKLRVVAVSNVPMIDRDSPYVQFVERMADEFSKRSDGGSPALLGQNRFADNICSEWAEFLQKNALWLPVRTPQGTLLGVLMLIRGDDWQDQETVLVSQLVDALGHAWNALKPQRKSSAIVQDTRKRRILTAFIMLGLIAVLALPVRQNIIASATVLPHDAVMIAAPIGGVIREIDVEPNAPVTAGESLFHYEDAELRANYDIALRATDAAEADLRRATQQAFANAKGRAEVVLQKTRLALRQEQAAFSRYQLSQVEVIAPKSGIAIFGDPNDWRGRPVSVGEQVMSIAQQDKAELGIFIPVSDAIYLQNGAEVNLFLDVDPLQSIPARLTYVAYQPRETAEGILAYRAIAQFDATGKLPRIGLKGAAKVMGERVPLVLFLFRRPLAALRQMVGF